MRIRIIIDTEDARQPGVETTPFTLNVYNDDNDGTQSRIPLEIGSESAVIGENIPDMLEELAAAWSDALVLSSRDQALPCNAREWQARSEDADSQDPQ